MTLQRMGLYTIDSVEVIADCALAAADKVVNSRHRILHIVALIQKSHKFAGAVLFLCWHSEGLELRRFGGNGLWEYNEWYKQYKFS